MIQNNLDQKKGLNKKDMTDAFGGSRVNTKPPERGVFALDHESECKNSMKVYLACLKQHNQDHFPCKEFSRSYVSFLILQIDESPPPNELTN